MVNYQVGKIYKLTTSCGLCYYGSTVQQYLSGRLAQHRHHFEHGTSGTTTQIFQADPDANIPLVESYPCNNVDELRAREQFWIDNNPCVNKRKACVSDYEERRKFYYNTCYEKHKTEILQKTAEYYQDHKEAMDAWKKTKTECGCGGCYTNSNKSRHFGTKRHQAWVEEEAPPEPTTCS